MQGLQVVSDHRQRHVGVAAGGEHPSDGLTLRIDEVGRQSEDGLTEAGQDRGEPAERRARHLVGDHDDVLREVVRGLAGVAYGDPDHREQLTEEGEVALQQRRSADAQPTLVAPHASRFAAGEHDADTHGAGTCRLGPHGEVAV